MSLYINLNNIEENIKKIIEYTNKELMAVIKDNAYGIGTKYLLPLLKNNKVKWIVYNKYKEYKIDKEYNQGFKILILESISNIKKIEYNNNLYYSINTLEDANYIMNIKNNINIHIQIDTGMNREGINNLNDYIIIINNLHNNKNINIDGIYTHYSSNCDEYYHYFKQYEKFKEYLKYYSYNTIHSVATSSMHKNIIGTHVRIGLGLYGYGNNNINLSPSISYKCDVIKIYEVNKGESIGYNQSYKVTDKIKVALVNIGYSDIRDIKYLSHNETKYFIIGSPCMNHMFIKIDDKINKLTRLNVLSKNDIISIRNNNWYYILMSIRNIPKNYIRSYYDLSTIYQRTSKKNKKYKLRRRGD